MNTTTFFVLSLSAFDDDCRIAVKIFPETPPTNAILIESVDELLDTVVASNLLGKDIQAIAVKQFILIGRLRLVND
jgi:hypothetical protein